MDHKSLLIPYNSQQEIFIQDRTGHKPPPWGFFGGSIESGESALHAIIRESKEELDIELTDSDLEYLGEFPTQFDGKTVERSLFLYHTDQTTFTVLEGAGGHWVSFEKAAELMHKGDTITAIRKAISDKVGELWL